MSDIAIIGAGKLGTNLGYALMQKGHRVAAISDKNLSSAQESQQIIGQGIFTGDNRSAALHGRWIILAVPDDMIEAVAKELADSHIEWQDKFVFHCSGLHSTKSLKPFETKGALVASLHPVRSFSQKIPTPKAFVDIFFGLEGKGEALDLAIEITHQLGGKYFILESQNKPLYHTACSMASNFSATLLDTATTLLQQAGLAKSMAYHVLLPLVQGTLQNVKNFDAGTALTGPIARGDTESVRKHLEALDNLPELRDLYKRMARQSLQIVKREKKLYGEKFKALEALLGGK
jgi:predicted short-subunit dehydrogenase-like oxidoreductase (DUF2520 family)